MRRAVILMLAVWLVIGGLSSWAYADRPGWVPHEFQRGGGDELESCGRSDTAPDDGGVMGMAPIDPYVGLDSDIGLNTRHGSQVSPFAGRYSWLLWIFVFFLNW
jgi:hypothetical protein